MSLTTATEGLRGRFGAEVILPGDAGYDDARALHNAMIDKRPAVIVRCGSAADVAGALEVARTSNLAVAVRGGGHNGPGFGCVDGGVVIDLSRMNRVDVDAARRTARVVVGQRVRYWSTRPPSRGGGRVLRGAGYPTDPDPTL
jgi:FAD/FMN-containing dehydrogenase